MAGKSLEDMDMGELYSTARSLQSKASLLDTVAGNPETRELLHAAIKKVAPNTSIPEYDAKQQVRAELASELKTEREKREELERKFIEREARDNVRERREAIKAKFRLTDDDVKAIEERMVADKEVNWTHEAAAKVYLAERQSATPTPARYAPPTYQMPEKETWAPGIGNPSRLNKIAMDQAYEAWGEIAGGKVAGLGGARLQ